ncbi:LAFA_0B04610g1_1 [Lachancea sp. 'fantastica']|nr:LAFA_0B04610g1_1 [Lachancea sp. 'fantastica']
MPHHNPEPISFPLLSQSFLHTQSPFFPCFLPASFLLPSPPDSPQTASVRNSLSLTHTHATFLLIYLLKYSRVLISSYACLLHLSRLVILYSPHRSKTPTHHSITSAALRPFLRAVPFSLRGSGAFKIINTEFYVSRIKDDREYGCGMLGFIPVTTSQKGFRAEELSMNIYICMYI